MPVNVKRIIREELARILEGDVVHVKFGGAQKTKEREKSNYQRALGKVVSMLEEIINGEGADMEDDQIVELTKLLDHVTGMQDDAAGEPDEEDEMPFGGRASGRERDELSNFKKYMSDRDRDRDY